MIEICHIVPLSKNGSSNIENLIALCPTHHALLDKNLLNVREQNKVAWRLQRANSYYEFNN